MSNDLLITIAICLIAQSLILFIIISYATRPTRRDKYQWQQLNILIKMAKKAGVTDEEINEVLNR